MTSALDGGTMVIASRTQGCAFPHVPGMIPGTLTRTACRVAFALPEWEP